MVPGTAEEGHHGGNGLIIEGAVARHIHVPLLAEDCDGAAHAVQDDAGEALGRTGHPLAIHQRRGEAVLAVAVGLMARGARGLEHHFAGGEADLLGLGERLDDGQGHAGFAGPDDHLVELLEGGLDGLVVGLRERGERGRLGGELHELHTWRRLAFLCSRGGDVEAGEDGEGLPLRRFLAGDLFKEAVHPVAARLLEDVLRQRADEGLAAIHAGLVRPRLVGGEAVEHLYFAQGQAADERVANDCVGAGVAGQHRHRGLGGRFLRLAQRERELDLRVNVFRLRHRNELEQHLVLV